MTHLLKQAFAKASKLPQSKQNALARWVLEELDSEKRWSKTFTKSQSVLGRMAEEALKEHAAGKTKPLHI